MLKTSLKIYQITKRLEEKYLLTFLSNLDFTYEMLTDCINDAIVGENVFPDSLKLADITPVHKKDETTNKENYRPVSVLPLISKIFERVIYDKLSEYLEKYLNST